MMSRAQRVAGLAAVSLCLVVVGAASPAGAEDEDPALAQLTAAARATAAAAATGIDVIQTVRFTRSTDLREDFTPAVAASVTAGSRVRVHVTANADGSSYSSVRRQPGGRLIGAAGRQVAGGLPWATVSMLTDGARARARSAGALDRTALTDLATARLVRDDYIVDLPVVSATRVILPPYAGAQDEGWTTVTVTPRADGTRLISGTIRAGVPASDGEDRCVRPLVEMVVGPDDVTRSSRWIETCPGRGTREYRATAAYGSQSIQPPTRPRALASDILG